jgi:preprotein translocase subunit SecG
MFDILVTIVTVFYVVVCLFMVLVILLQAGRGGMGTALGGGASQSVFGGGGSSDVLAKVTQWCAMSFMVFAMFLAYAGSHSGSSRLQEKSQEQEAQLEDADGEVNWEAIGPNPVDLARYAANPVPEPLESPATPAEPAPGNPADAAPADSGNAAAPADAAPAEGAPAEGAPAEADAKTAEADAKAAGPEGDVKAP